MAQTQSLLCLFLNTIVLSATKQKDLFFVSQQPQKHIFFTKPEGAFCVQLSAESNLSVLLMVTQNQFGDECLSLCACKPARTNDNHHSNLKTTGHKIQQH